MAGSLIAAARTPLDQTPLLEDLEPHRRSTDSRKLTQPEATPALPSPEALSAQPDEGGDASGPSQEAWKDWRAGILVVGALTVMASVVLAVGLWLVFHLDPLPKLQSTGRVVPDRSQTQEPGSEGPLDALDTSGAQLVNGAVRLKPEQSLPSRKHYSGAVEIDVVARTDARNIRLRGPRGSAVIFNWEQKPGELRVHRPDGTDAAMAIPAHDALQLLNPAPADLGNTTSASPPAVPDWLPGLADALESGADRSPPTNPSVESWLADVRRSEEPQPPLWSRRRSSSADTGPWIAVSCV